VIAIPMRRRLIAALVVGAPGLVAAQTPAPALLPVARGGFVVLAGADTFAVEHLTRSATGFEGELYLVAQQQRIAYTVVAEADARVQRVSVYQWAARADETARPVGTVQYRFAGDTLLVGASGVAGPERRVPLVPGTLPWVNPAFGCVEQLARRARRMGATLDGLAREIPIVNLGSGARAAIVVTAVGRDSLVLDFGGVGMRVAVDSAGRLLGGRVPAQNLTIVRVATLDPSTGRGRPDYTAPADAPYTAEEVRIPTPGGHVLSGTLTRPRGAGARVPVVVTITGSGPQDRDGRLAGINGYRPFRALADTLGRRGVAVLRFDERGVGGSTGTYAGATTQDFAADVRAALAWLRTRPDVDPRRLALLGHSEGGLVAPMVATTDTVAAVVLMAATAIPGRRILESQWRRLIQRDTTLPAQRRDSALALVPQVIDSAIARDPWVRYFAAYDPRPAARRLRVPVLVLQGTTDRQVTPDQADSLVALVQAGGNRRVTRRMLPGLDHLFIEDPSGEPTGYTSLPSPRLAPQLLGAVADWLTATLREPSAPARPNGASR
jgi:hypothetical protein